MNNTNNNSILNVNNCILYYDADNNNNNNNKLELIQSKLFNINIFYNRCDGYDYNHLEHTHNCFQMTYTPQTCSTR